MPVQLAAIDPFARRIPQLGMIVHVEHLHGGRRDQIAPPAEDAGGLRPADGLAAAEGHEIGAGRRKWRKFSRGGSSPAASTSTGRW